MMSNEDQSALISIFLRDLEDELVLRLQIKFVPELQILIDCFNRYAVKDGNLTALDENNTVADLKDQLLNVPMDELKAMLFKYSGSHAHALKISRETRKERLKHRLITYGFLLFALLALIFGALAVFHMLRNPEDHQPGFMTDILNIVVEVFRIVTNL